MLLVITGEVGGTTGVVGFVQPPTQEVMVTVEVELVVLVMTELPDV